MSSLASQPLMILFFYLGTIDPIFEVGSSAYNILIVENMYDLELCRYAVFLFNQKGIALNFKKRDRHE